MAEFKTPIKKNKAVEEGDKITIPPSPFLNRLGYGTERLQAEAELLKRMSHPNIVGFRAFSNGKILYLGMEACDQSLGDLVEKRGEEGGEPFKATQMLKVAADIGSALYYLHTTMQILHGDMKSFNVLINGAFSVCKLCDFGVTLPLDQNGVFDNENAGNTVYYGTEAWSAPEVIHGGTICDRTDVWALGLTLWEMMALMPPHCLVDDTLNSTVDSEYSMDSSCDESIVFNDKYGTRPAIPANISPTDYQLPLTLFHCCTQPTPSQRPTAGNLSHTAQQMMGGISENL